jgi:S1-C subfamily serine protease
MRTSFDGPLPSYDLQTDEALTVVEGAMAHDRRLRRYETSYPYRLMDITMELNMGERSGAAREAYEGTHSFLDVVAPSLWIRRHPAAGNTLEVRSLDVENNADQLVTYEVQASLPEGITLPRSLDPQHLIYTVARVSDSVPDVGHRIVEETLWLDEGTVIWRRERAFLEYRALPSMRLSTVSEENILPRFISGNPGLSDGATDARVRAATVKVVTATGSGTGVLLSHDGLILTARHVVAGVTSGATVRVPDLRASAEVIYSSTGFDFAILRAQPDEGVVWPGLACLPLEKHSLSVGTPIHALGFPRASFGNAAFRSDGVHQLTTAGSILSYQARDLGFPRLLNPAVLSSADAHSAEAMTLATIRVVPGMSGGPVVGNEGELLGISIMGVSHAWPLTDEEMVGTYLGILPTATILNDLWAAWGAERLAADLRCDATVFNGTALPVENTFEHGTSEFLQHLSPDFESVFYAIIGALPEIMEVGGEAYCRTVERCPPTVASLLTSLMSAEERIRAFTSVWFSELDLRAGAVVDADLHPGIAPVSEAERRRALHEGLPNALTTWMMQVMRQVVLSAPLSDNERSGSEDRVRAAMERVVERGWPHWSHSVVDESSRISVASRRRP